VLAGLADHHHHHAKGHHGQQPEDRLVDHPTTVAQGEDRSQRPKAEELAGAPPTLETKSDVVGEADETETAMTGILVGDEELKATKLKEQVAELIQKSPDTAVKVLNRWVSVEQ
jgi:hypothetical protein